MIRVLIIIALLPLAAWAETPEQAFVRGDFAAAIEGFKGQIVSDGADGANLFNLGLSYLAAEDYPRAIASFRKAKLFIPGDADLNLRLAEARQKLPKIERGQLSKGVFVVLAGQLPLGSIRIFALVAVGIFWTLCARQLLWAGELSVVTLCSVGIIAFYLFLSGFFVQFDRFGEPYFSMEFGKISHAVVVEASARVKAAPDVTSQTIEVLEGGEEIISADVKDDMVKVTLPSGRVGWVQKKVLELIE